jgi:hypothetical protein
MPEIADNRLPCWIKHSRIGHQVIFVGEPGTHGPYDLIQRGMRDDGFLGCDESGYALDLENFCLPVGQYEQENACHNGGAREDSRQAKR